ncbi:MAG: PQQ-binding-like beta-propeller repeat protein [Chloroflexi bacterium]|nr:PQQ-binding-like beta-propeller repeat protein [Chloroflexota bacterium]
MNRNRSSIKKQVVVLAAAIITIMAMATVNFVAAQGGPTPTPVPVTTAAPGVPAEIVQNARDWPLTNRDYSNTRATTDSPINSSNVNTLGVAWQFSIPGIGLFGGAAGSNPIILGDTVYFQDLKSNVFALDKATGQIKWRKDYNTAGSEGPNGPVVAYGKLFALSDPYTLVALDVNNGNELWAIKLSDIPTTGLDIQPTPFDNLIYVSTVPGTGDIFYAPGGRGILYAIDQQTGQVKWLFDTIKSPDLFGHPEINSGGGAWYPPAIDTNTGQMFWSIANPAPFPGTADFPSGSSFIGDTLYTDSLLSMNHATGELKWFNQVLPFDIFDHDLQISPILTRAKINDKEQDIVITAGKMGKVYAMNRDTGALLWVANVGEHNPAAELRELPPGTTRVIPGVIGGVETPMAYADGVVYVPVIDYATDWTPSRRVGTFDALKGSGELVAIEVSTGRTLWIQKFDYMALGAATVVNDLVFTADLKGNIYALKRDTGEIVWRYRAPAGINAFPAVSGDMIIWPAGAAGATGTPAVGTPVVLAFKLGIAPPTPTPSPTPRPTVSPAPFRTPTPIPGRTAIPTPTPTATPAATPRPTATPTPTPSGRTATVNLSAQNLAFNTNTVTVPAGAQVTVNFNNADSAIPHNFAVYTSSSAATSIFLGETITGPSTTAYRFTAPSQPGNYFFRCDVHPLLMTGTFVVTP